MVTVSTVAYRASDGAQLWARRYNGVANSQDFASSVTAGPGGAVFVTGGSQRGSGCYNYVTIGYKD